MIISENLVGKKVSFKTIENNVITPTTATVKEQWNVEKINMTLVNFVENNLIVNAEICSVEGS